MIQEQVIAESIDYLVGHYREGPGLEFLARRAGYETTHFQKLFKDHVGISPKRLCQYMHMRKARDLLESGHPTLAAAHESGLSGTGRLHDLFVSCEGVTPGSIQNRGRGMRIVYGFHPSALGNIMIGKTDKGVCWLAFVMEGHQRDLPLNELRRRWPLADILRNDEAVRGEGAQIMRIWRAGKGQGDEKGAKLKLDLYGTNFQLQVWQALLKIPAGQTRTYQDIGVALGQPTASRAVGNAVGANPVSLLIPCHRVIRASGIVDNYMWGSPRKKLLLAMEAKA
jgi:AraC family transcriptional regulator of adaptative response/methylated-DNA-[protein]-cysteine methyltransferase